MKRKILGSILFLYAAFIVSNLIGFKFSWVQHSSEVSVIPGALPTASGNRDPGRGLAADHRYPSTVTEAQVDLLQDNFKSLQAIDKGKENFKDLKSLVRSVLDERPIQVEFKKEEPSDWALLYSGIMESGPVAFVIFILGLYFSNPQSPKASKSLEIHSASSSIRLLVFNQTRSWNESSQEWTVHRRINFGFLKSEKTYQEKPEKKTA